MKSCILSISYELTLLQTRHIMLQQAGYDVVSVEGYVEAINACQRNFDLILMGHSIPQNDKRAIVAELRKHGCNAPVLSLLRRGESPIPEAAHGIDPSPEYLLETVKMMLQDHKAKKKARVS